MTYSRRAAFSGIADPCASLATDSGEKPRQKRRVDHWTPVFPVHLDPSTTAGDIRVASLFICHANA